MALPFTWENDSMVARALAVTLTLLSPSTCHGRFRGGPARRRRSARCWCEASFAAPGLVESDRLDRGARYSVGNVDLPVTVVQHAAARVITSSAGDGFCKRCG